jgi:hypothetical protein
MGVAGSRGKHTPDPKYKTTSSEHKRHNEEIERRLVKQIEQDKKVTKVCECVCSYANMCVCVLCV